MSVILNCEGTGRGSITYQWQTQDKGWTDVNNSNNRELVVMNLQESQQYRCVVINEAGRTISDITTLTILSKLLECHVYMYMYCYCNRNY